MTRKVIDFPTQLPHFRTTHVYIGLLLFFLPLKVSTTCYHLLPLYQSVLLSFKTYYIQSFNLSKFKIFSFFFPLMAQDCDSLTDSFSPIFLKTSSSSTSNFSGSKHRFLIHFINISIFFILFSLKNLRFFSISF